MKVSKSFILFSSPIIQRYFTKMAFRWYVPVGQWQPTNDQLLRISSLIQPEEKARIGRFLFMKDSKSSVVGRLLIRKLLSITTKTDNHEIELVRDEHNKPILKKPEAKINFNISHQGNFVVIASDPVVKQLGIDIMNTERGRTKLSQTVEEYFQLMRSVFTENEWSQIKGPSANLPIINFTRFWSLKESYVKAIGLGIVIDLKTVDFYTHSDLKLGEVATDTQVKINGILQKEWTFEEQFLDPTHIVAVAKDGSSPAIDFQEKDLNFLIQDMTPLCEQDENWSKLFLEKPVYPGGHKQ